MSKEISALREAAKKIGATRAIVYFTLPNGTFGYASYGQTKELCKQTRGIADECWNDVGEAFMKAVRKKP